MSIFCFHYLVSSNLVLRDRILKLLARDEEMEILNDMEL